MQREKTYVNRYILIRCIHLLLFAADSHVTVEYQLNPPINSRTQSRRIVDVSIANPMLSWEELIYNIYSLLQSAYGENSFLRLAPQGSLFLPTATVNVLSFIQLIEERLTRIDFLGGVKANLGPFRIAVNWIDRDRLEIVWCEESLIFNSDLSTTKGKELLQGLDCVQQFND
ncbi:hypothetical protein TNCV_4477191 [Trichonephila clavipes]|nr:hypothetical protein TNCV_4477191 [Trichonephila clavipes]